MLLPGNWYKKHFKNNLFMKIILIFSIIAVVTTITFSYLMFLLMSQSAVQRQLEIQKRTVESVNNYMQHKYDAVQTMMRDVYRDSELTANTSYLLEHPYQDYVTYRLERYLKESNTTTDSVQFFRNQMEDDPDIRSLLLYSSAKQQLYVFNEQENFNIISTNAAHSFVPDALYLEEASSVTTPNIWVRKTISLADSPMFSIRVPINDKQSLRNIGQLLVFYDADHIWASMGDYKDDFKGDIIVLSADNDVLFDSSGTFYGKKYPYPEQIEAIYADGEEVNGMLITKLTHTQGGFTVLSVVPEGELAATYSGLRNMIITICLICILFAVITPSLFISNFATRAHNIIRFTRKVKNGDLDARITDVKEDELGQISKSFNDMLDELNLYIDRVFKAEIKQKHSEIAALEARVNPHFLYNTLEVIRMRAISQGAADVGEMIYSLSVLFKSYVHPKAKHTLKDELEACRLYLELFRIRYKDKFSYELHCPKELEGRVVLKMSLQPVVENYILHGMRTDRSDNHIRVDLVKEGGILRAVVNDNGRGIKQERLAQIQKDLLDPDSSSQSFGLRSIHERMQLLYGEPHGLAVASEEGQGTTVTLCFPDLGEEEPTYV
ncbi:two-component sensor histidine kinase [Paenibacillus helianthi]|uniref:Two-component sensor histidine kinase n=1 Tax=Paenibacillus helianthi TaxID=1349432 RepID=A0ABX3ETR8_9BACL|nr:MULTISPECIES: histidine kinase [Paenibacillus]OKP74616.1 two-component sensor histidine kinase [Paenibacillus sp. P3E]OKP88122.1 two-component sensor histidine kinase [Paenibacillus helianthi]OKP92786.1 two-component sensor histidine kinase [Paenibacillus sp. P32E]